MEGKNATPAGSENLEDAGQHQAPEMAPLPIRGEGQCQPGPEDLPTPPPAGLKMKPGPYPGGKERRPAELVDRLRAMASTEHRTGAVRGDGQVADKPPAETDQEPRGDQ